MALTPDWQNPTHRRAIITAIVVVVLAFVFIEDWGRDFVSYEAALSADAEEVSLRPLRETRPTSQCVVGVRQAARRIRNLHYVGDLTDGDTTILNFVRTARLLRVKDDVVVRIENKGTYREIQAESRSRLHLGDLGRNTRNLRRFRQELGAVFSGAVPSPYVLFPTAAGVP